MNLWDQISTRPELAYHMHSYYSQKNQVEIRYMFASWIEDKILNDQNAGNDNYLVVAITFVQGLQNLVQNFLSIDAEMRQKFEMILSQYPPIEFYSHLKSGIEKEIQLINSYGNNSNNANNGNNSNNANFNIEEKKVLTSQNLIVEIRDLIRKSTLNGEEVQKFGASCDKLQIQYNALICEEALAVGCPEKENMFTMGKAKFEEYFAKASALGNLLVDNVRKIVLKYDELHNYVIGRELRNWQRNQALAANGASVPNNLNEIQAWVQNLLEVLAKVQYQISAMLEIYGKTGRDTGELLQLNQNVKDQFEALLTSTLVVEHQPPQIIKKSTRITEAITVRWLVGPTLGAKLMNQPIECIILSESQARNNCQKKKLHRIPNSCGEIANNASHLEFQHGTGQLVATFKNMILKSINTADRRSNNAESVTESKFTLMFHISTEINGCRIRAWELSLPVILISHDCQRPQSWATIIWDNAFAEINRQLFHVPDEVGWIQFCDALNTRFSSLTGRGLTQDNMKYIHDKLTRGEVTGDHKSHVTRAQFCKDSLPDRSFSFAEWFYAIIKLTKEHLSGPWQDGRIVGFIDKSMTVEHVLKHCAAGTFLLRFSDSELGGISVAWVDDNLNVFMLQPWTSKDLEVRSLSDRIQDLDNLISLYPNIRKDDAFGRYCSIAIPEVPVNKDGYVRSDMKTNIPGISSSPTENLTTEPNFQKILNSLMDTSCCSENWNTTTTI